MNVWMSCQDWTAPVARLRSSARRGGIAAFARPAARRGAALSLSKRACGVCAGGCAGAGRRAWRRVGGAADSRQASDYRPSLPGPSGPDARAVPHPDRPDRRSISSQARRCRRSRAAP